LPCVYTSAGNRQLQCRYVDFVFNMLEQTIQHYPATRGSPVTKQRKKVCLMLYVSIIHSFSHSVILLRTCFDLHCITGSFLAHFQLILTAALACGLVDSCSRLALVFVDPRVPFAVMHCHSDSSALWVSCTFFSCRLVVVTTDFVFLLISGFGAESKG